MSVEQRRQALQALTKSARGAPPDHGGPFCNSDHREGNLTRSRYHQLGVIQRFNILCDRSQIRI